MISFTGSNRTGQQIAIHAASVSAGGAVGPAGTPRKYGSIKTVLELGGKGANLLFAGIGDEWMSDSIRSGIDQVLLVPTIRTRRPRMMTTMRIAKTVSDDAEQIGPVVSQHQYERIPQYYPDGD